MSTLGTNVDLVTQKAPMSVSWRLNTDDCRVQEETREVTSVEEGHDVESVVETT